MAKRRIMLTTPRDSTGNLVFWCKLHSYIIPNSQYMDCGRCSHLCKICNQSDTPL